MGSSLQVPVSYDCDPDRVEAILLEVVRRGVNEVQGMMAEPAPNIQFDPGFGDSALGFTVMSCDQTVTPIPREPGRRYCTSTERHVGVTTSWT